MNVGEINLEKTECANGHPYDEANTYYRKRPGGRIQRACKTCRYAAVKRKRERTIRRVEQPMMVDNLNRIQLPAGPLLEAIERVGSRRVLRCESDKRAWCRMKRVGTVTLPRADEWAVRMGMHPAEIYGDLWWEAA